MGILHEFRVRFQVTTWPFGRRGALRDSCNGIFDIEDANHIQPARKFMAMLMQGYEFMSNPEENPACPQCYAQRCRRVILSDFFCFQLLKSFFKKFTADS